MFCLKFLDSPSHSYIFFFNDTATTEIYTLSLHDALPISIDPLTSIPIYVPIIAITVKIPEITIKFFLLFCSLCNIDRKSTRLNSSHANISYAVFCLKKKTKIYIQQ